MRTTKVGPRKHRAKRTWAPRAAPGAESKLEDFEE